MNYYVSALMSHGLATSEPHPTADALRVVLEQCTGGYQALSTQQSVPWAITMSVLNFLIKKYSLNFLIKKKQFKKFRA